VSIPGATFLAVVRGAGAAALALVLAGCGGGKHSPQPPVAPLLSSTALTRRDDAPLHPSMPAKAPGGGIVLTFNDYGRRTTTVAVTRGGVVAWRWRSPRTCVLCRAYPAPPAVLHGGIIAVSDGTDRVTALSRRGRVLWERPVRGPVISLVPFAGGVAVLSDELVALDGRGRVRWHHSPAPAAIAADASGTLYASGVKLQAFSALGRVRWSAPVQTLGAPVGGRDDVVALLASGTGLVEYGADGRRRFQATLPPHSAQVIAAGPQGSAFATDLSGDVVGFAPDGSTRYHTTLGKGALAMALAPTSAGGLIAGGQVKQGVPTGRVWQLDFTGRVTVQGGAAVPVDWVAPGAGSRLLAIDHHPALLVFAGGQ
jgi:PQQ-like domain